MARACSVLGLAIVAAAARLGLADGIDVKKDGAFAFPQGSARVLCDTPTLRLSACSDDEYLYVQAVLWTDGDNTEGETDDGRPIGDNSCLKIDADADGKITPDLDRTYDLNPWPSLPGLQYQVEMGHGSTSAITSDSKGRGAISYLTLPDSTHIRVDSYLIPLEEIKRKPGQSVRFAYWGRSPKPELTVNSVGYTNPKQYYSGSLPMKDYHEFTLAKGAAAIDAQKVPEGRGTIAVATQATKPMPDVGKKPPEVEAGAWLNWTGKEPPTLASLKGKVVVVEFWATWCGPCVQSIPHLNELYDKHAKQGLVILSLTDQKKDHVEKFMEGRPMSYTVGVRSTTADDYGVRGIPHAFIIGRDGVLVWHGHPGEPEFGEHLASALK